MQESTRTQDVVQLGSRDVLTEILRKGSRQLLAEAIEAEVESYLEERAHLRNPAGHRQVVRNGYLPEREVLTGIGPVPVKAPRVRDLRPVEEREKFQSRILPPYLRKAQTVEELLPWLYLKGISSGDMSETLQALLGPQAVGLSAPTVTRLTKIWETDYATWCKRSLAGKQYVYVWADGIHFQVRLGEKDNPQCILVLMGALSDGTKELIAIQDGYRESAQSWKELLLDCQARGMTIAPKLAIGDGALGFWLALQEVFPDTRTQRCWVHKTANILDKMPKSVQPKAKQMLHDIWQAETRAAAGKAFDLFVNTFQAKYPKAVDCLTKDRDTLLTFYDFPAEHWRHIRTTNPIESTFATVRLRTSKTKGSGSRMACLTMTFKLAEQAAQHWRLLNGSKLIPDIIQGVRFSDGLKQESQAA